MPHSGKVVDLTEVGGTTESVLCTCRAPRKGLLDVICGQNGIPLKHGSQVNACVADVAYLQRCIPSQFPLYGHIPLPAIRHHAARIPTRAGGDRKVAGQGGGNIRSEEHTSE